MANSLEKHREWYRRDFERVTGEPFRYFHCPMTDRDEPLDLCMGHVVSSSLGRSSSATVLQGAEVDAFYGSVVEADLSTAVRARELPSSDLFLDARMSRALGTRLRVRGENWHTYEYQKGRHAPGHTPVVLENDRGTRREIVIAKPPEEVAEVEGQTAEFVIDRDYTYTMIAGLLKAAHLTLFRMLGYDYALSAGGLLIGKDVLGRFFDEQRGRKVADIKAALPDYFHEWRNAVRPVRSIRENNYQGTVDDGELLTLHLGSGPVFALGVFVRTNDDFHQVLIPAIPGGGSFPAAVAANAIATYVSFIKAPPSFFHAKRNRYNRDSECWETSTDPPVRFDWPTDP